MIYFDHNATTPVLPEVVEAMMPFFREEWGNPSSSYRFGSRLKKVIETAREQVAELIGAHSLEIIFTSGGTESSCGRTTRPASSFRSKKLPPSASRAGSSFIVTQFRLLEKSPSM